MARAYYLPTRINELLAWLSTFLEGCLSHAAELNLSPAQLASLQDDVAMLTYAVHTSNSQERELRAWTAFKDSLLLGRSLGGPVDPPPPYIAPAPPASVPPGVVQRIRRLVRFIRASTNYNDAIGKDLGIIGSEPDTEGLAPKLHAKALYAGEVEIRFLKRRFTGIELFMERGGGGVERIGPVFFSPWVHKLANAEPGRPEQRGYKALYRRGDETVGPYSQTISVVTQP